MRNAISRIASFNNAESRRILHFAQLFCQSRTLIPVNLIRQIIDEDPKLPVQQTDIALKPTWHLLRQSVA